MAFADVCIMRGMRGNETQTLKGEKMKFENTLTGQIINADPKFIKQENTQNMLKHASLVWSTVGIWLPVK